MNMENIRIRDHEKEELSHYSNATSDLEYLFPFGWGELWGIADRTDFDLMQHQNHSGQDMSYMDPETHEKYVPYCFEPSLGADRVALAFLIDAYDEETLTDAKGKEDTRIVLRLHPALAPYKVAVLPLSNKLKEQVAQLTAELNQARADLQAAKSAQPAVVTAAPTARPAQDDRHSSESFELVLSKAKGA